jgi:two-component system, OmpR family, response regulator
LITQCSDTEMNDSAFRILIVEDDADLRESVARYLSLSGFLVTGVGSAGEFYRYIVQETYEAVLLDIGLPDQSGLVLADYVRRNTGSAVVILTAHSEMEQRVRGYSSGADLYLIKPVVMEELAAAIASLARRYAERSRTAAAPGGASTWVLQQMSWRLISPSGIEIALTGKEFELIRRLVEANGRPVPRRQLLDLLFYPDDGGSGRALDNQVRRLRKKIRERTGVDDPIQTYHSIGYCFSYAIIVR